MEYIFFNQELCGRFVQFAAGMGISSEVSDDAMEGSVVVLAQELDDRQMATLEAEYESLMDEQMLLADEEEGWVVHRAVGIGVTYANGESGMIRLPVDMAKKLMAHFTAEEIQEMVQTIADALAQPDAGPLCRKD